MVKFQDLCGDEKKALADNHPTTKFVFLTGWQDVIRFTSFESSALSYCHPEVSPFNYKLHVLTTNDMYTLFCSEINKLVKDFHFKGFMEVR